jgi:serine/threonine protein kinase
VDSALVRTPSLVPGRKLDRYELVCPIAEGGMASVWIARLTGGHGFEKYVAIKTILPQFASDARFQKMFIEESRIASRIEHSNVAQIRDVGEQDGLTYLVMEYVDGDSLWTLHRSALRKGGRVPPGVLLRIMADVCGGLHAAHELRDMSGALMRVVHRDVSPQNVLVTSGGAAKLIDFGIAKSLDGAPSDTTTGPLKGKVRYMAPEQARGEPLDRRADIWAVGAVLYYLFSGKAPCEGENEVATLIRLRTGQSPDPLPSSVPHAVAAVIMKALGMAPATRFAMAAEMQRALENAMAEADLATTSAGVAAFIAENAAESAQKRKNAIALGLKTAADRSSSALLEPMAVRTTSSIPPAATGSTMRASAVEVTPAPISLGRGFPTVPVVLGGLAVLAAVAVAARLTRHTPPASAPAPALAMAPPVAASVQPPPRPQASESAPADPAIRTFNVADLPPVPSASPAPAPPPPRAAVVPRPVAPVVAPPAAAGTPVPSAAPAKPPPAPPAHAKPDDGF